METADTVIVVFSNHQAAEGAGKELAASGFEMKNLSIVGKFYHPDEKLAGFYNVGDRVKFWGGTGGDLTGGVLGRADCASRGYSIGVPKDSR